MESIGLDHRILGMKRHSSAIESSVRGYSEFGSLLSGSLHIGLDQRILDQNKHSTFLGSISEGLMSLGSSESAG